MEGLHAPSEDILRQSIMELDEPVLFKNLLRNAEGVYIWKLLEWDLINLCKQFGDTKLPFRVGYNARSMSPQWETNCNVMSMTLEEFIQHVNSNLDTKNWYYFDYKYIEEWFKNKSEIINSLNWNRFGFNKTGSDSTLWIGSKGAHTNCHQDSYGCNLVAQIHGRKQWLLYPPSASNSLQPTRVPYEESTIYSKFNFFCPTKKDESSILKIVIKPKLVILEQGDVLFIPAGWWHYVESLDFSVSVNIWLPMISDNQARVKEAIVKLIVARIGKKLSTPSDEALGSLSYCMKLLDAAIKECKNVTTEKSPYKKIRSVNWTAKELSEEYPTYVKLLHELEIIELEEFLKNKRERFTSDITDLIEKDSAGKSTNINDHPITEQLPESVINALCHPDVINKVVELLLTP